MKGRIGAAKLRLVHPRRVPPMPAEDPFFGIIMAVIMLVAALVRG